MFTGIIETVGTITSAAPVPGGKRLRIEFGPAAGECTPGASISVSGACLTVSAVAGSVLEFDVIAETLDTSTLGSKRTGDRVNLERAMQIGGRFDGHFVQGHVDGIGTVDRVQASARAWMIWLRPESQLMPYIVPKGSVAIDGVSLTVAEVGTGVFSVALIPTTLERTTLAALAAGDRVNIESDVLVRTIIHHLSAMPTEGGLTLESLREAGFA